MHCLFNRGLCKALALMQHIQSPLKGMQQLYVHVFLFFFNNPPGLIQVNIPYVNTNQCWLLSVSRAFSQLTTSSFSKQVSLGEVFHKVSVICMEIHKWICWRTWRAWQIKKKKDGKKPNRVLWSCFIGAVHWYTGVRIFANEDKINRCYSETSMEQSFTVFFRLTYIRFNYCCLFFPFEREQTTAYQVT